MDMPTCIRFKSTDTELAVKDYTLTLIILADVSGSMAGDRLEHLKRGVLNLINLVTSNQALKIEFVLIKFNTEAEVLYQGFDLDQLKRACIRMYASGGTSISAAILSALAISTGKKAVHVVLFTDGEDKDCLPNSVLTHGLETMQNAYWHFIAVGDDTGFGLLLELYGHARRGTTMTNGNGNIPQIIGALYGFLLESVDENCTVEILADGVPLRISNKGTRQELILRRPGESILVVPTVPAGTKLIEAFLYIDDRTLISEITLPLSSETCIDHSLCATEYAWWIQAQASSKIAADLSAGRYTNALSITMETMDRLREMGPSASKALVKLEEQKKDIDELIAGETDHIIAQQRANSRSLTSCVATLDITEPEGRTLSEFQRQYSQA